MPSPHIFTRSDTAETAPLFARPPENFGDNENGGLAALPILRVVGQLSDSYILAEGPDGLYLIDQHAAHERVLFERIIKQRAEKQVDVQGLLEPVTIEVSPEQDAMAVKKAELLQQFGYMIEQFGPRTYQLRAVPELLSNSKLAATLSSVLDDLADEKLAITADERIAISLACHSAVRAGQSLSHEEMRALIRSLEESAQPRTCPHGRPTMIHLSSRQLQREFGRTG
jgi:DNA mismatch repair protein MutL